MVHMFLQIYLRLAADEADGQKRMIAPSIFQFL